MLLKGNPASKFRVASACSGCNPEPHRGPSCLEHLGGFSDSIISKVGYGKRFNNTIVRFTHLYYIDAPEASVRNILVIAANDAIARESSHA